ncbi:polysaccharide deacetylase family protein [Streptomyces sp. P6-2-1]|uniref:polysaccharide deacetylase family protein n=1 Tax=Streptomyces sp. P6-2-1 TaxID=3422591 RepID=UPI003D36B0A9
MPAEPPAAPAPAFPARTTASTPLWVLMYHSVSAVREDPYRVTVTPHRLERQLRWLRRRGLRGVSVAELLTARAAGRGDNLVGLTFDDGYADFLSHAVPLLHRYGCTATVFALPGRLGGDNAWDPLGPRKPLLTAAGLRRVRAEGMELASHGLTHVDLTRADDTTLHAETAGARTRLTALTGTPVDGFCYPYGTLDARAMHAVRAAGYRYACAIDPGPHTGPYALPRAHVGSRDTAPFLALKRRLHARRRPTALTTLPYAPTAPDEAARV